MDFESSYPNIYDCSKCPFEKCDWISTENDITFSENNEQSIIDTINKSWEFKAIKCNLKWFPVLEIRDLSDNLISYLEIKFQQKTFMSVKKILPEADLVPSETITINSSNLLKYFEIKDKVEVPIYIILILENRECIVGDVRWGTKYYIQSTHLLKKIYEYYWDKREYKWNYHFSLNELIEIDIENDNFIKILSFNN